MSVGHPFAPYVAVQVGPAASVSAATEAAIRQVLRGSAVPARWESMPGGDCQPPGDSPYAPATLHLVARADAEYAGRLLDWASTTLVSVLAELRRVLPLIPIGIVVELSGGGLWLGFAPGDSPADIEAAMSAVATVVPNRPGAFGWDSSSGVWCAL